MGRNIDKITADLTQDETGLIAAHDVFALPDTLAYPIRSQTPIERRFKVADLFQFQRGKGDHTFSIFLLIVVGFFLLYFPSQTGWDTRKIPDDIWSYLATQIGLMDAEGRLMRFGKIVKQGWVAPLLCLIILVPAALLNYGLSLKSLRRKQRQQAPYHWRYEMSQWLRALEYIGYFIIYTLVVPLFGYLLSTLAMGGFLTWRVGYRSWRWTAIALITSFVIVLLFRSFLQIKTPVNIWLYNQMPDTISVFLKTWF